jgi:glutathione S-transferase
MKLYYMPGACSLAPHIALRLAGQKFELEKVDTKARKTETGADYSEINPKGYVPALRLESGDVVTEGSAILQHIAGLNPAAGLAPAADTLARVRLQEHLNYIASELHKAFVPFFAASPPDDDRRRAAEQVVARRIAHFETLLSDGRTHLLGDGFTVADAYLFVVANWCNGVGIDLARWPHVAAFVGRIAVMPEVRNAMRAEGLIY